MKANEPRDPIDIAYDKWLTEFLEKSGMPSKEVFTSVFSKLSDDFKEMFKQGWLACEEWYGEDYAVIIAINPENLN
jgi:hypothetical protein